MAAVIEAGPPPANEPIAGRAQALEIRKIEIADVMGCIAKGVQDFYARRDIACFSAPSMRSAA